MSSSGNEQKTSPALAYVLCYNKDVTVVGRFGYSRTTINIFSAQGGIIRPKSTHQDFITSAISVATSRISNSVQKPSASRCKVCVSNLRITSRTLFCLRGIFKPLDYLFFAAAERKAWECGEITAAYPLWDSLFQETLFAFDYSLSLFLCPLRIVHSGDFFQGCRLKFKFYSTEIKRFSCSVACKEMFAFDNMQCTFKSRRNGLS